jgi:DNA mismatch endonuclease (patch repair protein)
VKKARKLAPKSAARGICETWGVTDTLTRAERSERMSRVRARDTKPEMAVRKLVFSLGYRYRLHDRKLPGTPDLVFASRRKAIFVHGCFWHRHTGCPNTRWPKSKLRFWVPKLTENRARDIKKLRKLRRQGWNVLVIWECEVKRADGLSSRITGFLEGRR